MFLIEYLKDFSEKQLNASRTFVYCEIDNNIIH